VSAGGNAYTLEVNVDIIPVSEIVDDLLITLPVGDTKIFNGLIRKDDAPTEGAVRPIALQDCDLVMRIRLLDQKGKIKPSGASTDDGNTQGTALGNRHSES